MFYGRALRVTPGSRELPDVPWRSESVIFFLSPSGSCVTHGRDGAVKPRICVCCMAVRVCYVILHMCYEQAGLLRSVTITLIVNITPRVSHQVAN